MQLQKREDERPWRQQCQRTCLEVPLRQLAPLASERCAPSVARSRHGRLQRQQHCHGWYWLRAGRERRSAASQTSTCVRRAPQQQHQLQQKKLPLGAPAAALSTARCVPRRGRSEQCLLPHLMQSQPPHLQPRLQRALAAGERQRPRARGVASCERESVSPPLAALQVPRQSRWRRRRGQTGRPAGPAGGSGGSAAGSAPSLAAASCAHETAPAAHAGSVLVRAPLMNLPAPAAESP